MIKVRSELPKWLAEQGYRFGAEIGVYKGDFTDMFCEAGLFVYAVDPWKAYTLDRDQDRHDFLYGHTLRKLAKHTDYKIIRKTSMDALADIPDESLDFVYIDGDHQFDGAMQDIIEWSNKVRSGGVVSGHDYSGKWPDVKLAVDAYVAAHKLELVTFGSREHAKFIGDRCQSFLWKKP